MYNQKRKQKVVADKSFQDQVKEVKNFLSDGKSLVERASSIQQYQQALEIFNKAIMKTSSIQGSIQVSNSYLLFYYRGICYLNLQLFEKAQRDFIQGASIADEKGKVQIYNSLGQCKVQMARQDPSYLQDAIKCYEKAIQFSKNNDGQAYFKLAQIYRKLKSGQNNSEAIKYYTNALKFLKSTQQQYQAHTQRGLCYRQIGLIQNSIEDFEKACQLRKDQAYAYFNLGLNYLLNCKYQAALQKFDIAIEINPLSPQYKNYKGLALYLNGQHENCLSVYNQALKLYQDRNLEDTQVGQCWYNLGNALLHLSRQQQAIHAFQKALNCKIKEDQIIKVYYSQGLCLEYQKNPLSIEKFKDSLLLIGDNKQHDLYLSALYHLSLNEHLHKKNGQAIRNINKIVQQNCNQKCIYELRGKIYLADQNFQLALKDFQNLLSLDQAYPDVYYYLGMAKANLGQIDSAIADFFKAVDLGSRNTNLMNGISYAYLKAKKPQKALIYINIALEKQPNNQQFLIQRSMVYLQLQQNHKSIQDLSKALLINSKNPFTYYRRGLSYYKNKQFQQAIQDLKKSLQFQPNQQIQSDIHYLIGVSYANKQEYLSAIQPFSKAIKLSPLPKYFHQRAKCHILLQNNKEALQDLNEVINKQPLNAFAYFRRGLAYKALKMYQQSAQNFMKARQISPDDPKLILNKKQIYEIKFRKLCEPGQEE